MILEKNRIIKLLDFGVSAEIEDVQEQSFAKRRVISWAVPDSKFVAYPENTWL